MNLHYATAQAVSGQASALGPADPHAALNTLLWVAIPYASIVVFDDRVNQPEASGLAPA